MRRRGKQEDSLWGKGEMWSAGGKQDFLSSPCKESGFQESESIQEHPSEEILAFLGLWSMAVHSMACHSCWGT